MWSSVRFDVSLHLCLDVDEEIQDPLPEDFFAVPTSKARPSTFETQMPTSEVELSTFDTAMPTSGADPSSHY